MYKLDECREGGNQETFIVVTELLELCSENVLTEMDAELLFENLCLS